MLRFFVINIGGRPSPVLAVALANGDAPGMGMLLPEGDKLGAKTETDNSHFDFAIFTHAGTNICGQAVPVP
jgi:hypothetical protein